MLAICALAAAAASASALPAPVITSVSPERAPIGYGPLGESSLVREVLITGEDLAEATVTSMSYGEAEPHEEEFEVREDTPSSMLVMAHIGESPGVQQLTVHTPGGTATAQVIYEPRSGVYPAIGRCMRASGGSYKEPKCSKSAGAGKYEWGAGLAGGTMSFASGPIKLGEVSCAGASGSGTLVDTSQVTGVVLTFRGCAMEAVGSCSSTGTSGEVEANPLLVDLAWRAKGSSGKKTPVLGIFPLALEGALAQFSCGGRAVTLAGDEIAALKSARPADTMPIMFAVKKGSPAVTSIEWVKWSESAQPTIKIEGRMYPERAPFEGTLTMGAPEPFMLNTTL